MWYDRLGYTTTFHTKSGWFTSLPLLGCDSSLLHDGIVACRWEKKPSSYTRLEERDIVYRERAGRGQYGRIGRAGNSTCTITFQQFSHTVNLYYIHINLSYSINVINYKINVHCANSISVNIAVLIDRHYE